MPRSHRLHQAETGVGAPSINSAVSALRVLFSVTLERPDLTGQSSRDRARS
jgi:hypothetical protein